MSFEVIVARIFLSILFVRGGWGTLTKPNANHVAKAAGLGLPAPRLMVRVNGGAMVLGGILVGGGIFPQAGALLLIASLIPTSLAGHAFWKEETPADRRKQVSNMLKNLGIIGGLILVHRLGPIHALFGW